MIHPYELQSWVAAICIATRFFQNLKSFIPNGLSSFFPVMNEYDLSSFSGDAFHLSVHRDTWYILEVFVGLESYKID